ncbi:MAG: efflux RND transporter periplasmic adaptor subunit [Alphaproteobacteria bacterium]|nr:efflux RND transporter periplasmic adaptor subunit [Alphaproteobacteria bacterium]
MIYFWIMMEIFMKKEVVLFQNINVKIACAVTATLIILVYGLVSQYKENSSELTLYGNVEIRQVTVGFQVPGKIVSMSKEEGDTVSKGEVIATLDDTDYKNSLEKAKADVKKAEAISREANLKYERNGPLCLNNVLAKQDYDTLLSNRDRTKADYLAAVAAENLAKNQLEYTEIHAPDDGIITTRIQEPGSIVVAGQGIYTICKNRPMWVRAYVSEPNLGNIKYGMKVKVLTDTVDPKTNKLRAYEGQIGYISPVAEFTPKTVQSTEQRANLVYRIRVYIDNIDEFLRQGMPTTIKIDLKS